MKITRFSLLAAPWLWLAFASTPAAAAAQAAPAIEQWHGPYGGFPTLTTQVLRGSDAWNGFWKQVGRDAPRALDPAREMAVAVFIGERRTGGYVVSVVSAGTASGHFVVVYHEQAPGPDQFVTEALTTPWVVAVVPLSTQPVVFQAAAK